MEEDDIANRLYAYLFYAAAVVCILLSIASYNIIFVACALLLMLFSSLYLNSGHILNNLLIKRSAVIEVYNGYAVNERLPSAVKKVGTAYLSISLAVLQLGSSSSIDGKVFRSMLENVREPFEFSIELAEAEKGKILETLEMKRRMKEIELTRADRRRYERINSITREIELINSEIAGLGPGKTYRMLLRLKTSARSADRGEAALESSRGIEHIAGSFASAFGLSYRILSGEELLGFIEAHA